MYIALDYDIVIFLLQVEKKEQLKTTT